MIRPVVRIRMYVLSAAVLLSTAACADRVTGPARARPDAAALSAASSPGELKRPQSFPNTTRYRWDGARPATGRSGTAALTTRALVGRDGKTELEVASGSTLEPSWAPAKGTITMIQTKIRTPRGELLGTASHTGLSAWGDTVLTYGSFQPGSTVEVLATVRDVDGRRTDVVAVTDTVRRRPNLAVTHLEVPGRVKQGSVYNVAATIAETNGDVGAWARCALYRDGQHVDWASSVWVDAGDVVTCAFTQWFAVEGSTEFEVRLEDVYPRDDDPADNTARARVEVVFDGTFSYQMSANQIVSHTRERENGWWSDPDGTRGAWELENRQESIQQSINLLASIPRVTSRPMLSLAEYADGTLVHSLTIDPGPADNCPWGQDHTLRITFFLCTGFGGTTVMYARYASEVTYHSRYFSRTWDGTTGEESVYHYNGSSSGGPWGILAPLGDEHSFHVTVTDGADVYTANPTVRLAETPLGYNIPLGCVTTVDWWMGGVSERCREYEASGTMKEGRSFSF